MKRFFFLAALIVVFSACTGELFNVDNELDGYWYMSSLRIVVEKPDGSKLNKDKEYTTSNSPRFMNVNGTSFEPYDNHGKLEWNSLRMTAGNLYTFDRSGVRDNDKVKFESSGNAIMVYGFSTMDYYVGSDGSPLDYNGDGVINYWDMVFTSGAGYPLSTYDYSIKSDGGPLSVTCIVTFSSTDKASLEAWLKE
ncbi:MAG: hypothetical protein J5640_04255 [Bacteroidales bacterium]|nr:hypothetical protein [Bacteroidales bacterium]